MSPPPAVPRRSRGVVIAVLAVVAIAAAIFVTIRSGTGGHRAPSSASPTTTTAGPAGELTRLLDRAQGLNVDARYSVTNGSSPSSSAHLWRRPPLARLDTETGSGDEARRTAQIITTSGPVGCSQTGTGPWACGPKPGLKIGDVDIVSTGILAQLSAVRVVARDDNVAGVPARCFTVSSPEGTPPSTGPGAVESAEVCVTTDGVPARVVAGTTRLDLVSLDRIRPPDAVFQPPA